MCQLCDVFSVKQNINLVLEYLDTDLEAVIRDKDLIIQQADIKSWMLMTVRGLEYIHRNGVLHRVGDVPRASSPTDISLGFEAKQPVDRLEWDDKDSGLWSGERVW